MPSTPTASASSNPAPTASVDIELQRVSVTYGRKDALSDVSLNFRGGSKVALVGSNGSGKTTLLKLIAGLGMPSKGTISPSPIKSVAYVGQHQHQHRWLPLTVSAVLCTGRYRDRGLVGRFRRSDNDLIAESAARLDVDHLMNEPYSDLSGGQKQRVLIATALISDSEILLLDEPITGLDLPSQERILEVIDSEAKRGRLVILSTHHLAEAQQCDEVVLLRNRVVAHGTPTEVLTEKFLAETFGDRVITKFNPETNRHEPVVIDEHGHGHSEGPGELHDS